jgi:hypothetical protein
VNSTHSGRLAACSLAMIVLMVHVVPASSQTVGLPPPSTFLGNLHRAPDGTIVVEPPRATTPSSVAAPSRTNAGKRASSSGGHPSAPSPSVVAPSAGADSPSNGITHPNAAASSATGSTPSRSLSPDELDDVSCKAIAWENLDYNQCRRDLKEERTHVPSAQTGTASSILSCTNRR